MLEQINARLKEARLGVRVVQRGDRLSLRATLPPKPNSSKVKPYQQYLSLGIYANPAGLKQAEAEAHRVAKLLSVGKFDWADFLVEEVKQTVVRDAIAQLEQEYLEEREGNAKAQETWRKEYQAILVRLPDDKPVSVEILLDLIQKTKHNSRVRRRTCYAARALAKVAGIELDISRLTGDYSPTKVTPRDLPTDEQIVEARKQIPNPAWRWVYGVMATYGLRNHEVFHLDLEILKVSPGIVSVLEGKTGSRRVWACYPEWWEQWELFDAQVPLVNASTNSELGHRVVVQFKRYGIPFNPYDLRHAWAVRTLQFGWDISLAAAQMGHSVRVHSDIYHHWITDQHHQRAFEILMSRSDRPRPPSV